MHISSGLETLDQAGIERRALVVFEIGFGRSARSLVLDTLINTDSGDSGELVARPLAVSELFALAFYFLRLGNSTILELSKQRLGIENHPREISFLNRQKTYLQ